jgi:hypothetical protein
MYRWKSFGKAVFCGAAGRNSQAIPEAFPRNRLQLECVFAGSEHSCWRISGRTTTNPVVKTVGICVGDNMIQIGSRN